MGKIWIMGLITLVLVACSCISNAFALTNEEKLELLEEKYLKGEIPTELYLELREKYRGSPTTKMGGGEVTGEKAWIWLESVNAKNNFGNKHMKNSQTSGGSFLELEKSNPPDSGYYFMKLPFSIKKKGNYKLWLAVADPDRSKDYSKGVEGRRPKSRSPIEWSIDEKEWKTISPANRRGKTYLNKLFTWIVAGNLALEPGNHRLVLRTNTPCEAWNVYLIQFDAAVLVPETAPWIPNGTQKPPVDFK